MAGRKIPLVTNEIYHILNRGAASQPTFLDRRDYKRATETMLYYQNVTLPQRYSLFLLNSRKKREEILMRLREKKEFLVELISYCFVPNHFHLLIKQTADNGTSRFIANFTNSYTRYFNTRRKRDGSLFRGTFKAVLIETEEQLWHVSRYVHLNPYSSHLVKSLEGLISYPYSSFAEYLGKADLECCQKDVVLDCFRKSSYRQFVFDQADYQRRLDEIKHLILE